MQKGNLWVIPSIVLPLMTKASLYGYFPTFFVDFEHNIDKKGFAIIQKS